MILIPRFREAWPEIGVVAMTGCYTRELELEVRQQRVLYYGESRWKREDAPKYCQSGEF